MRLRAASETLAITGLPPSETLAVAEARAAALALLAARADGATVCPSEVARALATARGLPHDWRDRMPDVHAAVDGLVHDGSVWLSWKGQTLPVRAGPYRLNRRPPR